MGLRIRKGFTRNIFLGLLFLITSQEWIVNEHPGAMAKQSSSRGSVVASTSKIGGFADSSDVSFNNEDFESSYNDALVNRTTMTAIERLRVKLLRTYDRSLPPVLNYTTSVKVAVDMTYRQVLDLDEKNQILKSLIWYRQHWKDEHLTWEPSLYDGIDEVTIPSSSIWRPDIAVYEEVGARNLEPRLPFVKLSSEGNIIFAEPTILETSCSVDTAFFPFDSQHCTMTFVSWTQPATHIDLKAKRGTEEVQKDSIDFFIKSGEWVLDRFTVKKRIARYDTLSESNESVENSKRYTYVSAVTYTMEEDVGRLTDQMFAEVRYSLIIRRNSSLYMQSMLFPSILLTSVALLGFYLPPDSGERVGLQITILLTFMVFLLTVGEMFPASTGPYIGIYFVLSMGQLGVNILMTIIVLHLHFKPCVRNKSSWRSQHRGSWFSMIGTQREPDSMIPVNLRRILQFFNKYVAIADDGVAWMLPIIKTNIPKIPKEGIYRLKRDSDDRQQEIKTLSNEPIRQNHDSGLNVDPEAESSDKISVVDEERGQYENISCKMKKEENDYSSLEERKSSVTPIKSRKKTGRDEDIQKIISKFRLDVKNIVDEGFDKQNYDKDTDEELEESMEKEQEEWKSVARAVDRLFFRLYLFLMFVSYVALAGVAINGNLSRNWDM